MTLRDNNNDIFNHDTDMVLINKTIYRFLLTIRNLISST
jgi:hypothetical protein